SSLYCGPWSSFATTLADLYSKNIVVIGMMIVRFLRSNAPEPRPPDENMLRVRLLGGREPGLAEAVFFFPPTGVGFGVGFGVAAFCASSRRRLSESRS